MAGAMANRCSADVRLFSEPRSAGGPAEEAWPAGELWAHRCLLEREPFFRALLSGQFGDSVAEAEGQRAAVSIDVSGLVRDGLSLPILARVLTFVYTGGPGAVPQDPSLTTELAAAAERLGVGGLVKLCERRLVEAVGDDASNATALEDFAMRFNLRRLRRHCVDVIAADAA